jgi:hypothetical protein
MARRLGEDGRFVVPLQPELDIVVWAPRARSASAASQLSQKLFDEAGRLDLHLALIQLPASMFPGMERDQDHVLCLRSVLMKPEHEGWLDAILLRLDRAFISVAARIL